MSNALIGLSKLHYAVMQTDTAGGTTTYGTPVAVQGIITAKINPGSSEADLYADDGPIDIATTIGKVSLELDIADLDFPTQAALLGHTVDAHGILSRASTDVPPWVAIGFQTLKSNGNYRFVWMLKGKFLVPNIDAETKKDKVAFQNPKIMGYFVKRDSDDLWMRQADEDATGYTTDIATSWFTDPNYA